MNESQEVHEGLAAIETEMHRIIAGKSIAYDCGWNIWGKALSLASKSPDVMHPLWLIWGALTDWVENRPEERGLAEAEMLRAAREWLALDRLSRSERDEYLQRWVYEEMGYERLRICSNAGLTRTAPSHQKTLFETVQ